MLSLDHNQVAEPVPALHFPHLRELLLSSNLVGSIWEFAQHSSLPELHCLDLSSNSLHELPVLSFGALDQLYLQHNKVASVLVLEEWCLPKLRVLDLRDNRIATEIPVLDMPCLERLLFAGNDRVQGLGFMREPQLVHNLKEISGRDVDPNVITRIRRSKTDITQ